MYCPKCGAQNPDGSRFCESCGSPLAAAVKNDTPTSVPQQAPPAAPDVLHFTPAAAAPAPAKEAPAPKAPRKRKSPLVWVLVAVIVLAGIIVGGWFGWSSYQGGQYREQLSLGEKYLKELNYDDAVVALKRAIEIDPRSPEPYLLLADVYVAQEDYSAAKEILEQGDQATGGNEEIKNKQEEVKQKEEEAAKQEEQKKQEELAQNAENLYADYLQNTLVPQYGLAKTSVSGTKHAIEDKWFDMSGIMAAKVLNLDDDNMPELLTVRMEAKESTQTGEIFQGTFDHILYLNVYQLQDDGTVALAGEQPLEYYTDSPQSQLSFNSIHLSDIAMHLNMVNVDGKELLVVEYTSNTWIYATGTALYQWTLEYQDNRFHYVSQVSSIGSGGMEYFGYEFQNDLPASQETLFSYIQQEASSGNPQYDTPEEAMAGFWADHGLSVEYHFRDDKFKSILTDENQSTPIMDFLIVGTQEGDSYETAHMRADITEQADLQTLLKH